MSVDDLLSCAKLTEDKYINSIQQSKARSVKGAFYIIKAIPTALCE